MKRELLDHLMCPTCMTSLNLDIGEEQAGQIRTGELRCTGNNHKFPISRFVPRFVSADEYADSFSKQRLYVRKHFKYYEKDRSGDKRFTPSSGLTNEDVRSGISLEVGCGYGRYLDVVQRRGGVIIGVDLSTHSVDLAQDFVGMRDNVHIVQCDLFKLPFPKRHFQNVFSLGVLHHTPSTRDAFEAIVPYARTGGRVSIWVYHPGGKIEANMWRVITTRLPHGLLYSFCILNQGAFSWVRALPGGHRFNKLIPGAQPVPGSQFWLRVLSDFDNLSPVYAHTHTEEEVADWFSKMGLKNVTELEIPTSVTGVQAELDVHD